jgi:hypothetical protein
MSGKRELLEEQLDSFDAAVRRDALERLMAMAESGEIDLPEQTDRFNMHCHSFFSYNGYGWSPSRLAWQGRVEGLCAIGLVDFDVLEGVEEFLRACGRTGLRRHAGMETRIYVPEFGGRVINSPGEPGICYHMGVGFTACEVHDEDRPLLSEFREKAQMRNRGMADRINAHLKPAAIDFDADVMPLTPAGNPTERHLCMAYDTTGRMVFPERDTRVAFWAEKLGADPEKVAECIDDPPVFQGLIRSKMMKSGGPGYAQPDPANYPLLEDVNRLILNNGAIPAFAFLDGTSEGEEAMDELLDVMMNAGAAMVNIIPDRNWNISDPETKRIKVANLNRFIENAKLRHLPIIVGTEMNAYGQRTVDDFDAPELAEHHETFLRGVHIAHAHTLLQQQAGMGYLSPWARDQFTSAAAKNRFYEAVGRTVLETDALAGITPENEAGGIEEKLGIGR